MTGENTHTQTHRHEKPGNHEKRIREGSLESNYNNVKASQREKDVVTLSRTARAGVTTAT